MWCRKHLTHDLTQWKMSGFIVVVTLTGKQILLSNHMSCHHFMTSEQKKKMRRTSGGSSGGRVWEEQVEVLTRGCSNSRWSVQSWCGDSSYWRAGGGGSNNSLRSSGKNWSEQACDCSCCLIRTDITQHNPPQQSVPQLKLFLKRRYRLHGKLQYSALWEAQTESWLTSVCL